MGSDKAFPFQGHILLKPCLGFELQELGVNSVWKFNVNLTCPTQKRFSPREPNFNSSQGKKFISSRVQNSQHAQFQEWMHVGGMWRRQAASQKLKLVELWSGVPRLLLMPGICCCPLILSWHVRLQIRPVFTALLGTRSRPISRLPASHALLSRRRSADNACHLSVLRRHSAYPCDFLKHYRICVFPPQSGFTLGPKHYS